MQQSSPSQQSRCSGLRQQRHRRFSRGSAIVSNNIHHTPRKIGDMLTCFDLFRSMHEWQSCFSAKSKPCWHVGRHGLYFWEFWLLLLLFFFLFCLRTRTFQSQVPMFLKQNTILKSRNNVLICWEGISPKVVRLEKWNRIDELFWGQTFKITSYFHIRTLNICHEHLPWTFCREHLPCNICPFPESSGAGTGGQTLRSQLDPSPNAPRDQIRR